MIRCRQLVVLAVLAGTLPVAETAFAHGGQYQQPPLYRPRPRKGVGPLPIGPPSRPTRGPITGSEVGPATTKSSYARLGPDDWTDWWLSQRRSLLKGRYVAATTPSADGSMSAERRRVIDALLAAVNDRNEDVATSALVALGRLGVNTTEPVLVKVLGDPSRTRSVREAAACGLALLGRGRTTSAAPAALESVAITTRLPSRLRAIAVYALGLRGDAGSRDLVAALATAASTDVDVAAAAASSLGLMDAPGGVEVLERLLEKGRTDDPEPALVRAYAAHGLAAADSRSSVDLLRKMVADEDATVRKAAMLALTALSEQDDIASEQVLRKQLNRDQDVTCRDVAVLCLGRLGHRRSVALLRDAWTGGRAVHPTYAATALGFWARAQGNLAPTVPVRKALSGQTDPLLRGAATVALAVARDRDVAGFLMSAVEAHGDPEVRAVSASVLPEIGQKEEIAPVLRRLLASGVDPQVRREAAGALGALGDVGSTPALVQVIESNDSLFERAAATIALGRIGGPGSVERLLGIVEKDSNEGLLRGLAAASLGILLEHDAARPLHLVGQDLYWGAATDPVTELMSIL